MAEETSWDSFLMMLSSEKTLAYWYGLKLPIERKRYSQAILFARGCLEVILYQDVVAEREIYDFQNSWKDYREVNSVLGDEFLRNNQPKIKNCINDEDIRQIFELVEPEIDFVESQEVYEWANSFFRDNSDSILESAKRIRFLLDEVDTFKEELNKVDKLYKRVKDFCNRVNWRNDSLASHFAVAREVYQMTLPNEFEMVLQDYFYEGARSSYGAELVEYNLQYVNFFQRWQELKQDIGDKNIDLLFKWLEETLKTLPDKFCWRFKEEDLKRLKKL